MGRPSVVTFWYPTVCQIAPCQVLDLPFHYIRVFPCPAAFQELQTGLEKTAHCVELSGSTAVVALLQVDVLASPAIWCRLSESPLPMQTAVSLPCLQLCTAFVTA